MFRSKIMSNGKLNHSLNKMNKRLLKNFHRNKAKRKKFKSQMRIVQIPSMMRMKIQCQSLIAAIKMILKVKRLNSIMIGLE